MNIVKNFVGDNEKSWDNKTNYALWADQITRKQDIGKIPFELVYKMEARLPIHLRISIYQLLQHFKIGQEAI